MKQYFIIKRPTKTEKILEKTAVEQLEREYQAIKAIGEHKNLIKIEEYHNEDNIVYLAFEFTIATSLYHYLATMGAREPIPYHTYTIDDINKGVIERKVREFGSDITNYEKQAVNTISKNNEPWTRYLFSQFIRGL